MHGPEPAGQRHARAHHGWHPLDPQAFPENLVELRYLQDGQATDGVGNCRHLGTWGGIGRRLLGRGNLLGRTLESAQRSFGALRRVGTPIPHPARSLACVDSNLLCAIARGAHSAATERLVLPFWHSDRRPAITRRLDISRWMRNETRDQSFPLTVMDCAVWGAAKAMKALLRPKQTRAQVVACERPTGRIL